MGLKDLFHHHDDIETITPQEAARREQNTNNDDLRDGDNDGITFIPLEKHNGASKTIGQVSQIDVIAPAMIAINSSDHPDTVLVQETGDFKEFYQPYYVPPAGYPYEIDSLALMDIISHGYVDISISMRPRDNAKARKELQTLQTIIDANLDFQSERGMDFQTRDNILKTNSIDTLIDGINSQTNRVFDVMLTFLVSAPNANLLDRHCREFTAEMANIGFTVQKFNMRTKSGYLSTIPFGVPLDNLDDAYRTFDQQGLAFLDTAQNEAGKFNGGIPFARNLITPQQNLEYLNVFGTKAHRPINSNMGLIGESGAGKSAANKIKIFREVTMLGYYHRSIDPDREYVRLAQVMGQLNLDIGPDSDFVINPCALSISERELNVIEDETQLDTSNDEMDQLNKILADKNFDNSQIVKHDGKNYLRYVPIQQKIVQIKDFIEEIFNADSNGTETMSFEERDILEKAIRAVFDDMGINVNPTSLITNKSGNLNGLMYDHLPKPEPTLSDIDHKIREMFYNSDPEHSPAKRLLAALAPYLKTGSTPLFDGQTYFGEGLSRDLSEYHYVNFNIADLSGSFKNVAYYVLTQILWNDWITNPEFSNRYKILDADEILQEIDNDRWASFMELVVRQCRKYNAGITWIAQDLDRIEGNEKAKALISNSNFFFFTRISPTRRSIIQNAFHLNDGVVDRLCSHPDPGTGVLINGEETLWVQTWLREADLAYAESNSARQGESEKAKKKAIDELNTELLKDRHVTKNALNTKQRREDLDD